MRVRLGDGLLVANVVSLLEILLTVFLPENPLRIVVGIPFVLVFPGYALIACLVPNKTGMNGVERLVLSFAVSIAMAILIGLALNFSPLGISTASIVFSLAASVLLLSQITRFRRRKLPEEERFSLSFTVTPRVSLSRRPVDIVLSILLVFAILASLGAIGYVIARPAPGEEYTEFYILGPSGTVEGYPFEIKVGQRAEVIIGIINHFHRQSIYTIDVMIDGTMDSNLGPIDVGPGAKWEGAVSFVPETVGSRQKAEFLLGRTSGGDDATQSLHLWVDVVP